MIPGFQGLGHDGRITTLGRGGSDTTAVAFAAVVLAGAGVTFEGVTLDVGFLALCPSLSPEPGASIPAGVTRLAPAGMARA